MKVNMSIKLKRLLLIFSILFLTVALLSFICVNYLHQEKVYACEAVLEQELKIKYVVGDTLQIPTAKLTYNEQEYEADKNKVVYPSGITLSKNEIELNEAGVYTLYYYKNINGDVLQGVKTFTVLNNVFSVGSNSSSFYGTDERLETQVNGINVSLANGEEFKYNIPLNLSGKTKNDTILSFFAMPAAQGMVEANEVYVKLTDAYNEENYILVKSWHTDLRIFKPETIQPGHSYQSAKAGNQPLTGIQVVSSSSLLYNGEYYSKRVESDKGFESCFSFTAAKGYGVNPYTLSMNYADKEIYGSKKYNTNGGNLIVDFDNSLFVSEAWEGFTTGECYLSIYAQGYNSSKFNFFITDILGEDLAVEEIDNSKAPIITVDEVENVYALINKPFKVFDSSAYDIYSGMIDCDIDVLYNGYADIPLIDGVFTPKKEGMYTIKYTAKGLYGTTTSKSFNVEAIDASITSVDFGTLNSGFKTGEIAEINVPVVSNASGEYKIKLYAKNSTNNDIVYDLELNDGKYSFMPLYSGNYSICCDVEDYNGISTFEKEIEIVAGNYVIKDEPIIPNYFIKNATYDLGEVHCYKLSSGVPEEKMASIYYTFDNGVSTELQGSNLTIQAEEYVKIQCYYDGNLIYEKTTPVVDVGYATYEMEMSKYFVSKNNEIVFDESDKSFSYCGFVTKKNNSELTFIKDVLVDNFRLTFSVPECNFKVFNLNLKNNKNELSIKLTTNGTSKSILSINDKVSYLCTDSFESGSTYVLRWVNDTNSLNINNKTFKVSKDVFSGFDDVIATMSIKLQDVDETKQSKVLLQKVNNQTLSGEKVDDFMAPELYCKLDTGLKEIGQEMIISNIKVVDVLSVGVNSKLTVTDPNGNYVSSSDGTQLKGVDAELDYKILLNSYGTYKIVVLFEDDMGNMSTQSFSVVVMDLSGPVIHVDKEDQTEEINSEISLRSFTLEDNIDSASDIKTYTIIIAPSNISYKFSEKFKLEMTGVYKVIIYAIDTSGNTATATYNVVVNSEQ